MHYTAICQPINRSTTAILHLRPTHTHLHLHLPDGWIIVTDCTHAPGTHPATLIISLRRVWLAGDPPIPREVVRSDGW